MKYCSKCGFSNEDNAAFCASCGESLQDNAQQTTTETYYTPPVQPTNETYYTPPVQPTAPVYDANQVPVAPVGKNPATLWLILNIVATVLCCGNLLTIIGIIFAAIGMGAYNRGDTADGDSKVKIAKLLFIVGLVLGLILLIGVIVMIATGIIDSSYYWYY